MLPNAYLFRACGKAKVTLFTRRNDTFQFNRAHFNKKMARMRKTTVEHFRNIKLSKGFILRIFQILKKKKMFPTLFPCPIESESIRKYKKYSRHERASSASKIQTNAVFISKDYAEDEKISSRLTVLQIVDN